MNTELEIKNYALALVGSEPITDTTNDKRSRLCDMFYNTVRDTVLREHNWNFAMKTVELAPVANPTPEETSYVGTPYSLPANCVKIVKLENYDGEYITRGSLLYADMPEGLVVTYVANDLPPSYYTPDFTRLLCLALAIELSYPLVQSGTLHDRLLNEYAFVMKNVRFNNAIEKSSTTYAGSTFTNARLG